MAFAWTAVVQPAGYTGAMTMVYKPTPKRGDRVKVKSLETSIHLPLGLNDGDEVTIASDFDHGSYQVEKDGQQFRVDFVCLDIPCLPWPPKQDRRRRR